MSAMPDMVASAIAPVMSTGGETASSSPPARARRVARLSRSMQDDIDTDGQVRNDLACGVEPFRRAQQDDRATRKEQKRDQERSAGGPRGEGNPLVDVRDVSKILDESVTRSSCDCS